MFCFLPEGVTYKEYVRCEGHVSALESVIWSSRDPKAERIFWPESPRQLPGQPRLPTAIFTSAFWQVKVIEQAFCYLAKVSLARAPGLENTDAVGFNTPLIGPRTNRGCNGF